MGKRIFTSEQLSAIETRDRSLLVSAAAGSGKTATLTERIIRSITDAKQPEDINRMLIVTFTNAAVAELKDRITAALKEKLIEDPENKRLEHQLYMLPSAQISTIDSFCNDILKNNTARFGISPKYRIADPIEAGILSDSILSALIDAVYNGELADVSTPAEFEELAACLVGVKNDSALEDVLKMLYERSKSNEMGVGIYRFFADRLGEYESIPIEENVYADFAVRRAKETAAHYLKATEILIGELGCDDKYTVTLSEDITAYENILAAKSYSEMKRAVEHKFASLPTIRGEKTEAQQRAAAMRADMKKALCDGVAKRYFEYSEDEWRAHISDLRKLLTTLALFLEKFDSVYFEEKRSRAILEYSDVERLTYLSLYNSDGSLSEIALSEREKYSSVYIDEYQDVNALQNKIFLAVSKPRNRFTVGDIKQSIYGFRSACPDIFAAMKNSYPPLDPSDSSDTASIFMSKNFRCDRGIVDFVNAIFDNMFSLAADSIGYVNDDRLEYAKIYDEEPPYTPPEVILFQKGGSSSPEFEEEEEQEESDPAPLWIAEKIRSLIDNGKLNSGEPIRPRDVAIIIRKDHGRAALYAEALEKLGISVRTPENKNFFLNSEIQLVLCLLNAINNPLKDIYLAGLMLSPIFDFTADELYLARRLGGLSLWESVKRYAEEHPEEPKFNSFINTLNRYRAISEGMQVDNLILRLYNETGMMALGASDGSRENLMLLYNYARKFEASSFKGLYNFINYVNNVIASGASFSAQKEGSKDDAVTIITVHRSKGLEFPVVFLADAGASLTSRNERNVRVAFSEELGLAMRTRVPGGLALVESPIYNAIIDRNIERSVEEELRVYYVALTRAREQLYVVGSSSAKSREDFEASAKMKQAFRSPYILRELKTFIDILYAQKTNAVITWQDGEKEHIVDTDITETLNKLSDENSERTASERLEAAPKDDKNAVVFAKKSEYDGSLYEDLAKRFSYKYPRAHLTRLPEKMSISNLYPTVLDGIDDEVRFSIDDPERKPKKLGRLPEFITGSDEYESAKRGIATHNFMQFFDVASLSQNGVRGELERLVSDGFISGANAARVRLDEIELFARSELYKEMRDAKSIYREFRFSVMLPAQSFTASEEKKQALASEKILLQGVIDCIIEAGDGSLHLIDYKTDRLTKAELADKELAKKKLSENHSLQLSYYALAIEKMFGRPPETVRIYSLPLGDTVDIARYK